MLRILRNCLGIEEKLFSLCINMKRTRLRLSVYLRNKRFALFSSHRFPNCDSYRFRLFHREATYVHVELHVRESSMLRAIESKLFYFSFDHSEPLGPV